MNKQFKIEDGIAVSTGISWCTHSWGPLRYRLKSTGKTVFYCQRISDGCRFCYAHRIGKRFGGPDFTVPNLALVEPFIDEKELHTAISMRPALFAHNHEPAYPAPHTRPAIFVGDMTDLWGDWVPFEMIDRIMAVAALRPDITFQFLTKRTARMVEYFGLDDSHCRPIKWPLPNVLLGFSAENQEYFDSRWADMRKLAAMGWKVFASIEPQIAPVDCIKALGGHDVAHAALSWAIIGGESGHGARPFNPQWALDLVQQFKASAVPLWVKQMGANRVDFGPWEGTSDSHGADWNEWPPDLRVRQLPEVWL
jgi:protein gp37